jgi:colanic acid/amylovoran biosynthesis glycosyltransferase
MIQKPIKVAHFKYYVPRLTENWIYQQFVNLDGVSTKFYAVEEKNEMSFPLADMRCLTKDSSHFAIYFNRKFHKKFGYWPHLLWWFWKDRPDIIHSHYGHNGCRMLPYAKKFNLPLVTSFYGADAYIKPLKPYWHEKYRHLFKQGQLFLAEGPSMRKKLISLDCPCEKVIVHHIGIKLSKYKFKIRQKSEEIRLLVCGRFVEKKGIPYAVEALKQVKAKTKVKFSLTIVGDSDSEGTLTEEKKKILDSINICQLADSVTITGYIPHDELIKIAYDHHIFLAPSIHASNGDAEGGFPVVLTELSATGMPVVAFDHCDIPEIVQNGKSGFIVPERDVDALAGKLIYLIEHPEIWPEMGRAGRNLVEKDYDIDKLNGKLAQIYQHLAKD